MDANTSKCLASIFQNIFSNKKIKKLQSSVQYVKSISTERMKKIKNIFLITTQIKMKMKEMEICKNDLEDINNMNNSMLIK